MIKLQRKFFSSKKPKIVVITHERSGTHFMMNSLALSFGYEAVHHIPFDQPVVTINFYHPASINEYFRGFRGNNLANIFKCHHAADFFEKIIGNLSDEFKIIYVYRNPMDCMISFWAFVLGVHWLEGPKVPTVGQFLRHQPCGQLLRYQVFQNDNMLKRWETHVLGWHRLADTHKRLILPVKFEDLHQKHDATIEGIGKFLGLEPRGYAMPDRDKNVVFSALDPKIKANGSKFGRSDISFLQQQVGTTMKSLGYGTTYFPKRRIRASIDASKELKIEADLE